MPSAVAGILTSRLGWSIQACRPRAAATVAEHVVRQLGRDLDGDEAVGPVRAVVERPEHRERVDDVGDDELPVGVLDGAPEGKQRGELLVVVG